MKKHAKKSPTKQRITITDPKAIEVLESIERREGKSIADLLIEQDGVSLIRVSEKTARRLKEIADAVDVEPSVMLDHLLILPELERSEGELIGWFEEGWTLENPEVTFEKLRALWRKWEQEEATEHAEHEANMTDADRAEQARIVAEKNGARS